MRVLALAAALALAAPAAAERHLVEGIVVRVNDRILTTRDMHRRMVERAAEMGREVQPSEYERLVTEAADELCLLERAAELKMDVTKDEVDSAIEQLKADNRIPDDAAYRAMLESTGMTDQQLRSRMHDTILVRRVLAREVGSLPLTEEEVRQRYEREKNSFVIPERLHLQHIVLSVAADRRDEAAKRGRLERLAGAVRSGNDFLVLVEREVSEGGAIGGDLGEVQVTDLRGEVRQAVENLAEGALTPIFESSAGLHLVYLVKRIPSAYKPFEEVSRELKERELGERYNSRLSGVVADLKTRYVVETHPEFLSTP
jgi:parvulin-like peptidyl-prolyl isomerase